MTCISVYDRYYNAQVVYRPVLCYPNGNKHFNKHVWLEKQSDFDQNDTPTLLSKNVGRKFLLYLHGPFSQSICKESGKTDERVSDESPGNSGHDNFFVFANKTLYRATALKE